MVRDRVRDGIIILVDRARAGDRDGQARGPIQEVLRVSECRFRLEKECEDRCGNNNNKVEATQLHPVT